MAQRRHYTSEFCGICKSNRNGKKKDGSSRMCIDYRKLNQKLVKDKFPLPIIEDVLDTLQEARSHCRKSGTIKPSPTKTLAVRKFPELTTIKQVQSFLGITGYLRKYIKDYSKDS
ncbi:transposon Tf2-8 polyprotein [Trichonephila clavipes]|uniref:Transposon Tf2-8 polyprotein n=1 Tax=Trichonephila clavipes TaxID=2585209 RepID=A0A8X6UXN5_TRICX|nr:transposon Tf2-8 polyprotein [Trichonephila clavipes]